MDQQVSEKVKWWYNLPLMREYERLDYVVHLVLQWMRESWRAKTSVDTMSLPDEFTMNRLMQKYDGEVDKEQYRLLLLDLKVYIDFFTRAWDSCYSVCPTQCYGDQT